MDIGKLNENFMIELYLHIKLYLDYFPGRLKYAELEKSMRLTLLRLYHNTYPLILYRFIYKPCRGL